MSGRTKLSLEERIAKKELEYRNTERKLKRLRDELSRLYREHDTETIKGLQEIFNNAVKTPIEGSKEA